MSLVGSSLGHLDSYAAVIKAVTQRLSFWREALRDDQNNGCGTSSISTLSEINYLAFLGAENN